jgi:CheY-like chemotaxis protein
MPLRAVFWWSLPRNWARPSAASTTGPEHSPELALHPPDVILLDLIMPKAELDGLGFLSQLAASPAADIPIIVISALGEPLGEELSPQVSSLLHFAAILPKPIPLETLAQALAQLLGPVSGS